MLIVPETYLYTCSSCMKYLSYKPVKKYETGEIKCGRCVNAEDGGIPFWFSCIDDDSLFPCINRFSGCRKLLATREVPDHERVCRYTDPVICPVCKVGPFHSLVFLTHITQQHKDLILPSLTFELMITSDQQKKYIYVHYNDILNITVNVATQRNQIEIHVQSIGMSKWNWQDGLFWLEVSSHEKRFATVIQTAFSTKNYSQFNIHCEDVKNCRSIECSFKSNRVFMLSRDYIVESNLESYLISKIAYPLHVGTESSLSGCRTHVLIGNKFVPSYCSHCKTSFYQDEVYTCTDKNHYICGVCFNFDIHQCEDGKIFEIAIQEKNVLDDDILFTCKWLCGLNDRFPFLNCHEIECEYQPKRVCPVLDCQVEGTLRQIFLHFQKNHSFKNIKMYDYWQPPHLSYTLENISPGQKWYYFASNDFVCIECNEEENNYKFRMQIMGTNKFDRICCALIKFGTEKGQMVEGEFETPKDVSFVYIKVYFKNK